MKGFLIKRGARVCQAFLVVFLLLSWVEPLLADPAFREITILVPAERGGGWDLTAKAMSDVLLLTGGAESVKIKYSPGAGGLIGLAQFVGSRNGEGNALMVGGMFTIGAVAPNHSAISLLNTTPLARLTLDNAVIAVPASSKIKSADGLIEALLSKPESISWVGGSKGGVDEMMLLEVAKEIGVAPSSLHYTPLPGGGEVGSALALGQFTAGISGYSEFENLVNKGDLRILTVVTKGGLLNIDVPSLDELGIKIKRLNWRGIFAPPGIDDRQLALLMGVIKRMVQSTEWQELLHKNHWQDSYLPGAKFVEFVRNEQNQAAARISADQEVDELDAEIIGGVLFRRYAWALALGLLSLLLVVIIYFQRSRSRYKEEGLQHALESAIGEANIREEELEKVLAGIYVQSQQEFDNWGLSSAERDIALLTLKGLRLKEIASARGTSERTVRQQAQAVYKKAGLDGRADLAAYFIEDFMQSMESRQQEEKIYPKIE